MFIVLTKSRGTVQTFWSVSANVLLAWDRMLTASMSEPYYVVCVILPALKL